MQSFRVRLSPAQRAGGRLIEAVRFQLANAFLKRQEENGLRQVHLAKALGIHRSVVTRALHGDKNMTVRSVGELANAMGYLATITLTPHEALKGHNGVVLIYACIGHASPAKITPEARSSVPHTISTAVPSRMYYQPYMVAR